jgi:hypothetical protein
LRKPVWFLIIIVLVALILFSRRRNYNNSYTTSIKGPLNGMRYSRQYTSIFVNSQEYSLNLNVSHLSNNKYFSEVASFGDTVLKPANDDTLTLIHKGNKYLYTFVKY